MRISLKDVFPTYMVTDGLSASIELNDQQSNMTSNENELKYQYFHQKTVESAP